MKINDFNTLANDLGLEKAQAPALSTNVFAGSWKGFPVSLSFGMSQLGNTAMNLPIFTIHLPLNETLEKVSNEYSPKSLVKLLTEEFKKDKIGVILNNKTQLHFIVKTKKKDNVKEVFDSLLSKVDEQFKTLGIQAHDTCEVCNQSKCDSMYFNEQGNLLTIHNACKSKLIEQTVQHYNDTETNAKNLRGLLGLLVGGFIGALPSIIGIVFANTEFMILYALIPLASFYGFKLLGGQPSIISTIVIAIWSLIQVFIVVVLSFYFYYDALFSVVEIIDIMFLDTSFLLETTWFGLLSVGLGLIPTISEGLNTANKKAINFQKSLDNTLAYTSSYNEQPISNMEAEIEEATN